MAVAKRSLADLAAAFTSKANEGGGNARWKLFFNFWKAPDDSVSTVRFLPDADEANPLAFLVENLTHELQVNGKRERVACLKMYGEACPICELSARFYDKNSAEHSEELGKTFYRKKSYIAQALILETPVEHDAEQLVKLIDFGPQVFKQIQAAFGSGDLEAEPQSLKGGYNFRFRKTKTGSGQNSYTTSNFSPKQTDVADELIASIKLYNLAEYREPKTERAALDAMLIAATTGGTYEAPGAKDSGDAPKTAAPAPAPTASATVTSSPATTEEAAPAAGNLSIVEQLRQRAAAAKAAQAAA